MECLEFLVEIHDWVISNMLGILSSKIEYEVLIFTAVEVDVVQAALGESLKLVV